MAVLFALIVIGTVLYLILATVFSFVAYSEGKWDSQRYYKDYDNDFWMPMAYFYDRGYAKYEGSSNLKTTKDKNRERFGRK